MSQATRDDETSVEFDGAVFNLEAAGETMRGGSVDDDADRHAVKGVTKRRNTLSGLDESEIEETLFGPGVESSDGHGPSEPGLDSDTLVRQSGSDLLGADRAAGSLPESNDADVTVEIELEAAAHQSRDVEAMAARAETHAGEQGRTATGQSSVSFSNDTQPAAPAQPLEAETRSEGASGSLYEHTAIIRRPVFSDDLTRARRSDETPTPGSVQHHTQATRSDFTFDAEDLDDMSGVHFRRRWTIAGAVLVVFVLGSACLLYGTGMLGSGGKDVSASASVSPSAPEPEKPKSIAEPAQPTLLTAPEPEIGPDVGERAGSFAEAEAEREVPQHERRDVSREQSPEKREKRKKLTSRKARVRGRVKKPAPDAQEDEESSFLKRSTLNPFDGDD